MIIGVPKEIKIGENRVAATPAGVETLAKVGHKVLVERKAGEGSGFFDEEYKKAGAEIVSAGEAWGADLVLKVKEPLEPEYQFFREGLLLFTYLHLANPELKELTERLLEKKVTAIAYETVQLEDGSLPLLKPMSEVAGKLAVQVAAHFLEKTQGGKGKLLGGVTGMEPGNVVIIGAGTVGENALKMAQALGAKVTILDINIEKLKRLEKIYGENLATLISNPQNIKKVLKDADVLIGAVLVPGAKASKVVTREMVKEMPQKSVIVDVAIDQGGCIETSRPTSHENPVFVEEGVIHYCVPNIPGAVPQTSTFALTNATLPYVLNLANLGFIEAIKKDLSLTRGVNVYKGKVNLEAVAKAHGLEYKPLTHPLTGFLD